ncbi:MAG: hypothetical protein ACKPKO_05600, partial [Candidatus Fonsibacter sp.]
MMPDHMLVEAVRQRLPQELRRTWMLIARNMTRGRDERDAEAVASWISQHGEGEGFRTPNVSERGRAMGMASYLNELGLSEQEPYDAQGNSF